MYNNVVSSFASINASVVQGSAVDTAAFRINTSDLRPITAGNELNKYADDSYLIVPATLSSTWKQSLIIFNWAITNNLKLNTDKSEIVFTAKGLHSKKVPLSLPVCGIPRVESLVVLSVTINLKIINGHLPII